MFMDVARHLGAVTREVAGREHLGQAARVLVATRAYDTSPEDLWDALTSPERLPRWFLPVSGDLRVGGRYALKGNASGEIRRCDPPHVLHLTWEMGGQPSWVQVTLTAEGARTRLELEHIAHVPEELWSTYGPGATGIGWELGLLGLAEHIATGEAVDPQAGAAWPTTPEGRGYVTAASERWANAAADAGDDPAAALAAAARVAVFYTGA